MQISILLLQVRGLWIIRFTAGFTHSQVIKEWQGGKQIRLRGGIDMADAGKLIANNKKAYHDYFIEEKYEAGISLHGT